MSWWDIPGKTCVAAYQAIGQQNPAAALVNLANPGTYNAVVGVAPVWTRELGWAFNGTTMYLNTGVVPLATYCMSIRFSGMVTVNGVLAGSISAAGDGLFYIAPLVDSKVEYGHGANVSTAPGLAAGVLGIMPLLGFRNGVSNGAIGAFTGTGRAVFIGATNSGGVAATFAETAIQALAIHDGLTEAQMATLYASMAALTFVPYPDGEGGSMRRWAARHGS